MEIKAQVNEVKKTKLYSIHEKYGAKLVDFAGYVMPIQYDSIIAEHKTVRNHVGLFDVSHMGEVFIEGERALEFVQHITTNDVSSLFPGRVQYSAMCYEDGGIVDDLLVYKLDQKKFMLVINASNVEKDVAWMNEHNEFGVTISNLSDEYSLIAVQGPYSKSVIESVFDMEFDMEYYHFTYCEYAGEKILLSRTGYTGELGYELYFTGGEVFACKLWDALSKAGNDYFIKPCGLGSRDSLRLEMGYCLYGNDINQTTNPLEAGLGWITKLRKGNFIGKEAIVKAKELGLTRQLVALIALEKSFPRSGYEVYSGDKLVGKLTSGTVSPVLEKGICLAYIDSDKLGTGTNLEMVIRGKRVPVAITKLPFIKK
jgi:aminomethyltransferase